MLTDREQRRPQIREPPKRQLLGPPTPPAGASRAICGFIPGAAVAGAHIHDHLEERFELLAGRVGFQIAGVEQVMDEVIAELGSRTYSPVTRTAKLSTTEIPWWNGRRLHRPDHALL